MAKYEFIVHGPDRVEYIVGRKRMDIKINVDKYPIYIDHQLLKRWRAPHQNKKLSFLAKATIAHRLYRYLIKIGKDQRRIGILNRAWDYGLTLKQKIRYYPWQWFEVLPAKRKYPGSGYPQEIGGDGFLFNSEKMITMVNVLAENGLIKAVPDGTSFELGEADPYLHQLADALKLECHRLGTVNNAYLLLQRRKTKPNRFNRIRTKYRHLLIVDSTRPERDISELEKIVRKARRKILGRDQNTYLPFSLIDINDADWAKLCRNHTPFYKKLQGTS